MSTPGQTIQVATDHAGFLHKEAVKAWLTAAGYVVIDHGAFLLDPDDDYTDTISLAAAAVKAAPELARAIIFGGSGQGEAMLANRYPGVRATAYSAPQLDIIRLSREHNDANVLSIGARFVSVPEAIEAVELWLKTKAVVEERHVRRNQKLEAITRQLRTT
jgi:ribose 5-phosphate isomerase B